MKDFNNEAGDVVKLKGAEIKNRLNPYILDRLERLEGPISDEWLDQLEEGCKALIADMNVRKTLAREHAVSYILQERGIMAFGLKEHFDNKPKENIDKVVRRIKKEKKND